MQNSLAAISIGYELGFSVDLIKNAMAGFKGVKRRFTKTGEEKGLTIIDDYGHHPVEIATTLKAAKSITDKKVIAVFQPHKYTRVKTFFDDFCTCFSDADTVIVADIYAANEKPIEGITHDTLFEKMKTSHAHVLKLDDEEKLAEMVHQIANSGDIILCLGAGSITEWAYAFA